MRPFMQPPTLRPLSERTIKKVVAHSFLAIQLSVFNIHEDPHTYTSLISPKSNLLSVNGNRELNMLE